MPVPHQIADQPPIVGNLPRPLAVAHAGRLHDRLVVSHHVDQADEPVVEHGEFFPTQGIGFGGIRGHRRRADRGAWEQTEFGGGADGGGAAGSL